MAEIITIPDLENGKVDIDTLADIVNLQDTTTETRLSGPVKTWYGVQQDLAIAGGLAYETLADLQAVTGTQGQIAEVTNDGENSGRYSWQNGAWVKSDDSTAIRVEGDIKTYANAGFVRGFDTGVEDLLFVVTDSKDNQTWLGVGEDGGPSDTSIKYLSAALGSVGESDAVELSRVFEGHVDASGNLTNIIPVMSKMATWGSSTFQYADPFFQTMASDLGVTDFIGGGVGGEKLDSTMARMGSKIASFQVDGGVIPAGTESVWLIPPWGPVEHKFGTTTGTLNGVHGTIGYYSNQPLRYRFNRTVAGEAVPSPGSYPFTPDEISYRDAVVLLNLGKNNITNADASINTVDYIVSNTVDAFTWLSPLVKRAIVVGHFANNNSSQGIIDKVAEVNRQLSTKFVEYFYDINAYVMGPDIWIDTGITPTASDLEAQADGRLALSLARDVQHLNDTATAAVVNNIKEDIISKGWYV